jgi:arylsulfatase A-like enzyme
VIADDISPHLHVYGEATVQTPNLDRLAGQGVRFDRAFVTGPVCSASRSALITGVYQTTLGAHNHRSRRARGRTAAELAPPFELLPRLFQEAGYYTSNGDGVEPPGKGPGKADYNFVWDRSVYDGDDWSGRAPGQPFFAQVQLEAGKKRHDPDEYRAVVSRLSRPVQPDEVTLPPYYPDDPVMRRDWAEYLNAVQYTDYEMGRLLERLEAEKVLANTYVFFLSDHGVSHARGKMFLYDEGIRIPFIARGPRIEPGGVRADLVLQLDLAATSLALAGIPIPTWMDGRDLFATDFEPRAYVVSARDRADETVDRIRSVRTERWKYIRNGYPQRPYLQPNSYKDHKPILVRLREMHRRGELDAAQSLIMASERPREELYDLRADPWEIHDLAADPASAARLEELRGLLDEWIERSGDRGQTPEDAPTYASEMELQIRSVENPVKRAALRANVELMQRWAAEGR